MKKSLNPPFVVRGKKREGVEEEIRPLLNN
jgi:hypothetical protein